MAWLRSTYARRAPLAALACAAIALGGCTQTVDSGDAEGKIEDEVKRQRNIEVDVNCPSDMEAKKGQRYQCTLTEPSKVQLPVTLEMTDDDGGFRFEVGEKPKSQ
jgi:hypothetical protein